MKFLDAEFVQGFIRMANDGWEQGWHERNGGNLSYRVKPEEVPISKSIQMILHTGILISKINFAHPVSNT